MGKIKIYLFRLFGVFFKSKAFPNRKQKITAQNIISDGQEKTY